MLKEILFDLSLENANSKSLSELLYSLDSRGIRYTFLSRNSASVLPEDFLASSVFPKECLILTDSCSGTHAAKKTGIPCIGYAPQKSQEDFSLAYALLESFDGADPEYLCRTHAHAIGYPAELFSTERLIIREFSDADFPALYSLCSEPSVACSMEESLSDYDTEQKKHTAYVHNIYPFFDLALWGIFEKNTGNLIGRAGYSLPADDNETFSLGYMIAPAYRRKGYATECIRALLTYAKEQGYTSVSAKIKKANTASQRTLEKCNYPYQCTEEKDSLIYLISLDE